MAGATGFSHTTIRRIWTAFGLQPHRSETFKLSSDPLLVDKVRNIVGLYLSPPNRALVLSVDEKSQIQALDREQPVLPMMPGIPEAGHIAMFGTARPRCLQYSTSPPALSSASATNGIRPQSSWTFLSRSTPMYRRISTSTSSWICVDTPVGARRIFSKSAERGRVLTCVRPLLRLSHAAGPYGSSRIGSNSTSRAQGAYP